MVCEPTSRFTWPGPAAVRCPATHRVTVAICTFRAEADLRDAVASVQSQLPEDGEVVVVRSGTTDDRVPPVLADLHAPPTVVAEPRVGATHARAAALDRATSDLVLFLDDDCVAAPGWAAALIAAMDAPGTAAAGGVIVADWPQPTAPRWLPDALATYYGIRPTGSGHQPFGANMAMRRSTAAAVGGLDPELGHRGSIPGLHEETDLCDRLVAAGWRVADVPEAVVRHRIRPEQVRVRWILRRAWHEGRSDARRARRHGRRELPTRVAKLAGLLVAWPVTIVAAPLAPRAATYVTARVLVNSGYLREALTAG